MIEKLNDLKLDDDVMDKIEGGVGSPQDAKLLQLSHLGDLFHFAKNVAGNNSVFLPPTDIRHVDVCFQGA